MSPILMGTLGGLVAAAATAAGALPAMFGRRMSQRMSDTALGFAAGVMLSAAFFSLIVPGLEAGEALYGSLTVAALVASAGIALGAAFVWSLDKVLPHEHFATGLEGADPGRIARIWLFVIAITIHNLPEGLSIGVAFGGGDVGAGLPVTTGISLQDIPEGLAVAVALTGLGYGRLKAFLVAAATGLVEALGGFLGAAAVAFSGPLLPWGLTFAAGAMIYIISHEIVPETHRSGHQNFATAGLIFGVILMMFLDVTLG